MEILNKKKEIKSKTECIVLVSLKNIPKEDATIRNIKINCNAVKWLGI